MSNFILIDGVVPVLTILLFYVLTFIEPGAVKRRDFVLGLAVMALIFLKWSCGLIMPFLLIYYLTAFPEMPLAKRVFKAAVPMMLGAILIGLLLWLNHSVWGSWVPKVFQDSGDNYRQPFTFYLDYFTEDVLAAALIPFLLFGFWVVLKSQNRHARAQGLWAVFAFLVISAMPNKDSRFMLFLIPSMVLVAGMGFERVLTYIKAKSLAPDVIMPLGLAAALLFILCVEFHPVEKNAVNMAYGYVGFSEAGAYVREQKEKSAQLLVIASSPRTVRYFSGINFQEFGGTLFSIPDNTNDFIKLLDEAPGDVVLVVDLWEWAQPKWIYPFTSKNAKFLKESGFSLVRVIEKDIFIKSNELVRRPVIWIFQKKKTDRDVQ